MKLLSILFAGLIVALVFLGTFFLILLFYIYFESKVAGFSLEKTSIASIQAKEIFFRSWSSSGKHHAAFVEMVGRSQTLNVARSADKIIF